MIKLKDLLKEGGVQNMKRYHFENCGKSFFQKMITCSYCSKSGGSGNMKRYHFDNCKNKA